MSAREKPGCLVVCSGNRKGVNAQSFIHSFTLTSSAFNVYLATPGGSAIEFIDIDESNRQWIMDFRSKALSNPHKLEEMDSTKFVALVIPSSPGAMFDLTSNQYMAGIVTAFIRENKPICAVGYGVFGLFSTLDLHSQQWSFRQRSLTAPSLIELSRREDFSSLPVIAPDFIRKYGGIFSSSQPGSLHVVIDNYIVTGQNDQSTLTAVQNLILLNNARMSRNR